MEVANVPQTENPNAFAIPTQETVLPPKPEEAIDNVELRANELSNFLLDISKRREYLPQTRFDEICVSNLAKGVEILDKETDGKPLPYGERSYRPLTFNDAAPWVRPDGDTMLPAARGETGALQIIGIKMRQGDNAVCVDSTGQEIVVTIPNLRRAQGIVALDVAKAEAGTLTAEENATANEQLLENGFIPTDSAITFLTNNKKALPEELEETADPESLAAYNTAKEAAEKHNEPIDRLLESISTHGVLTENDFKQLFQLHGETTIPQIQDTIDQIDASISEKRELLAKLSDQHDTGLTQEIADLQMQKKALETSMNNYNNPEKIAALYSGTRSPEVAKQISQFLEEGDMSKAMDTLIETQMAKLQEGADKEAARRKFEALKKRGEQIMMGLGGGAALIIYLMFIEGMKQQ